MDGGAWWAAVHGVGKCRTQLSDFTFTFHFHALEKEMATHSNILAWRIPGMEEPGGLLSMGSQRVGHDWSNLAAAAVHICQFQSPISLALIFPSGNHKFCFLHLWLYLWFVNKFICTFLRFHMQVISSICLSLSYLLRTAWSSLGLIHVAANGITSVFLWLGNIPLYMCTISSLSIHLLMDI